MKAAHSGLSCQPLEALLTHMKTTPAVISRVAKISTKPCKASGSIKQGSREFHLAHQARHHIVTARDGAG
jgi:hypothetical protein